MNKVFIASDGVRFGSTAGGLAVITASGEHTLTAARVVADAVTGLNEQPLGLSEMSTNVLNGAGALKNFALLQGMVSQFTRMGLIAPAVMDDGRVLAKLLRKGQLDLVQEAPPAEFVLSRHVVATPDGEGMLLDSGTSGATVWVAADQLPLLFHSNLGAGPCQPIGQLLWQAGLGVREVEPSFPDRMWHPVELLATHIAIDSRAGRPYGGTYRFEAEVPAPGLTDGAVPVAEVIPYPEAADDWSTDPPYGEVVRARESRFDFTTGPAPTLAQVIGILRRTTTVREFLRGDRGLLATRRYVPSGGGLHEVDLYLAVSDVEGLAPGLYRNEPVDETLQRVETRIDPQVLIDVAGGSFSPPTTPSFVILFVARFDRLMWKYEGVAASLMFKHVGILTHALHLAATVEGVGACAQGGAAADLFEKVTGLGLPQRGMVGQMSFGPITPKDGQHQASAPAGSRTTNDPAGTPTATDPASRRTTSELT